MLLVPKNFAPGIQTIRRLKTDVRLKTTETLIAGDFNAWHTTWGSRYNNARGEALVDMISSLGMNILNRGNAPTFQRGNAESIVDLTLASHGLITHMANWRVSDATSLSDHNYIRFDSRTCTQDSVPPQARAKKFRIDYRKLEEILEDGDLISADQLNAEECATALAEKLRVKFGVETDGRTGKRASVYWSTPSISNLRKAANQARRVFERKKRRLEPDECAAERDEMKKAKLELTKAIKSAKESCWKQLCDQVERDPWGEPYKLIMGKLTKSRPPKELRNSGVVHNIVRGLFPEHPLRNPRPWQREDPPQNL